MLYRNTGLHAMKQRPLKVIYAAAVRDATGVNARPGAVLVQDGKVLAAGEPGSLPAELVQQAEVIDRRDCLLLPGLVNAHTHLELTPIGPQPYDAAAGFMGWVNMLRSHWPEDPGPGMLPDDRWFVAGAERGAALSKEHGVQAVGDISRFASVAEVRRGAGLDGLNYLEIFGMGVPFDARGKRMIADAVDGPDGLQPHAPYSAGPALFEASARSGLPVCTHLAETLDEAVFVGELIGPKLEFLQSRGLWDQRFARLYGKGVSPVQWMRSYLQAAADSGGWLVAHCNYVSDEDIAILADTNTSVAYCPIASEYFGHGLGSGGGHRYRDMLDAEVNVCLGTDSIVCQPPEETQPLGLLAPMRRLYERDGTDPATLLKMATVNGAKALRMPSPFATLQAGAAAKFACIEIDPGNPRDPLEQVLANRSPAEPLWFTGEEYVTE